MAVRHRRKRCGASSSARPWFARYDVEHPLFKQARCRAVGLQMRRVDHDALGFRPFARKPRKDTVENTEAAPADEAVIERLVRTVVSRRFLPLQPVPDHIDDAAYHAPVIDPRNTMRKREMRRYSRNLALAQQNKSPITASFSENVNHISSSTGNAGRTGAA